MAFVAGRSSERPDARGPRSGRRGADESRSKGREQRDEKSFKKDVHRASLKSDSRTKRFLAKTSSPRSSSSRTGR